MIHQVIYEYVENNKATNINDSNKRRVNDYLVTDLVKIVQEKDKEEESYQFLQSCMSEGSIPMGLQAKFQLAYKTKDEKLVQNLQMQCNWHSSRILDILIHFKKANIIKINEKVNSYMEYLNKTHSFIQIDRIKNNSNSFRKIFEKKY